MSFHPPVLVYDCPVSHDYVGEPSSTEEPERLTENGYIYHKYPFACRDHAQNEYKEKCREIRREGDLDKILLQGAIQEAEKEMMKAPKGSFGREMAEAEFEPRKKKLQKRIEDDKKKLDTLKAKLKERWRLDPK